MIQNLKKDVRVKTLYKWAGAKNRMIKKYENINAFPDSFVNYHEPFFGAGAVYTKYWNKGDGKECYINDSNRFVMGIYRAIQGNVFDFVNSAKELQEEYLSSPKVTKEMKSSTEYQVTRDRMFVCKRRGYLTWEEIYNTKYRGRESFYYKVRDRFRQEDYSDTPSVKMVQSASDIYFLINTCFNGVWQDSSRSHFSTPVGLMNQASKFVNEENILEWHNALSKTKISDGDYKDTIENVGKGDFVFLDPPYRSGKDVTTHADYGTASDDVFQHEVIKFALECDQRAAKVMLANRDCGDDFFKKAFEEYPQFNIKYIDTNYTMGTARNKKDADGNKVKDTRGNIVKDKKITKAREVVIRNYE